MDKNLSSESSHVLNAGGPKERDSWKTMATKFYSDVIELVDKEGRIIRAEMNEKVKYVKVTTILMMISGLLFFIGAQCFAALAILALSEIMPLWVSMIAVTASFFMVGGLLFMITKFKFKAIDLKPKKSMEALDQIRYSLNEKVDEISNQ